MNNEPAPAYKFGDQVRHWAAKFGWQLAKRTVILEGETDAIYFTHAARLYTEQTGLHLLTDNFGVTAVGFGEEGGTSAILEKFPWMHQTNIFDSLPSGKTVFRLITLLDSDRIGRQACAELSRRHASLVPYRDIFVLQRVFPRQHRQNTDALSEAIKAANAAWNQLDCEIEDLICPELLELFVEAHPSTLAREPRFVEGAHHYDFTTNGKSKLCRWIRDHATYDTLQPMIETIQSLRYYLGLNPLGEESRSAVIDEGQDDG